MRRFISIIVSLTVFLPLTFTQYDSVDSLRNLLPNSNREDKIELCIQISQLFNGLNIDSALHYANRSLSLASRSSDEELLAE